ncbi:hypothetical protein PMZ80_009605 [Knufia obscura]|uniref:Uncharacterized protein n=2 Tax=Knufia TaxID=430999 RepID=A0AAN8I5P0_9EURO|nr:hypothetical protein PMZ80_009605 [Knufia obscura]KAK5951110.1 hypothetical protein OHC33_007863 [Knufia fluminis]
MSTTPADLAKQGDLVKKLILQVLANTNQLRKDVNKVHDILQEAKASYAKKANINVSINELDERVEELAKELRDYVSKVKEATELPGNVTVTGEEEDDELKLNVKWKR